MEKIGEYLPKGTGPEPQGRTPYYSPQDRMRFMAEIEYMRLQFEMKIKEFQQRHRR